MADRKSRVNIDPDMNKPRHDIDDTASSNDASEKISAAADDITSEIQDPL
jgi:hypothetical protein